MLISYKLPFAFDADSLKADLGQIAPGEWTAHFNKGYYEGMWKGLALRSTTGRANQLSTLAQEMKEAVDTPVLARCPYFQQVISAFQCHIHAARLLSLSPGSKIIEHKDYFMGYEEGLIRIHIPVTTDARVEFFIDNRRIVMSEGEAWYIDFGLPHRVNNVSDIERVHLVVDCRVNDWIEKLIPFADGGST
ncbi:MAG TPA: aspartyl/asparaginyl beta-hydroxylase domain-containing protein [Pyrinomonadaceae bacterium]